MLDSRGGLAAAEIAFFAPTLLIGIYVCLRHGFKREGGWLYIILLAILRLVGASCLLYAEINNDPNRSLIITYAVCSSVGTAPLLLALMAFLVRLNQNMEHKNLDPKFFIPIRVFALTALILVSVGGAKRGSDVDTAVALTKAAVVLFLAIWATLSAIAILTHTRIRYVLPVERKLLYATVASVPFLLVRIVYSMAVGFSTSPSSPFYTWNVNSYVQGFMQFAMEAMVIIIYVSAGLMTPKAAKRETLESSVDAGSAKSGSEADAAEVEMEAGRDSRR